MVKRIIKEEKNFQAHIDRYNANKQKSIGKEEEGEEATIEGDSTVQH